MCHSKINTPPYASLNKKVKLIISYLIVSNITHVLNASTLSKTSGWDDTKDVCIASFHNNNDDNDNDDKNTQQWILFIDIHAW